MASVTLYPSDYDRNDYKYRSVNTSYPLSNPVGKASSNTTYSEWNLTTGNGAESYVFYLFNCSVIPEDATIDSVACTAKAYISQTNSSRISTRQIQLYSGNTAKGGAATVANNTNVLTLNCGSWTRSELNNCRIRIYAKRGSSNTTTTYAMRFYGATLTINYTVAKVKYTIVTTIQNGELLSPTEASAIVEEGSSYDINFKGDDNTNFSSMTVNGSSVTPSVTKEPKTPNAVSLFHFENNINDSLHNSNITNEGTSINAAYKKFGSSALRIDEGSYLIIELPQELQVATFECWFIAEGANSASKYPTLFSTDTTNRYGGTYIQIDDGGSSQYPVYRCNATPYEEPNKGVYGSTIITRNVWHHFAYCRNNNTHLFFIDGILQATISQSDPNPFAKLYIGILKRALKLDTATYFTGYVDEILVSNVCKWTSNFTVPDSPYKESDINIYKYTITPVTTNINANITFIEQSGTGVFVKVNEEWKEGIVIYKKVNGAWITSDSSAIDKTKKYKHITV